MASKHIPFHVYLLLFSSFFLVVLAQTDIYIVHMDKSAMPKSFSDHHNWYLATLDSLSPEFHTSSDFPTISSKLIYSYTHAIHGFSAKLTLNELEALKRNPAYVSSIKDKPAKLDTTYSSKFLGLNSNSGSWPVSNFGKDVIIGVVDTGIWPESESFKDTGFSKIPARWKGKCEIGTQFNSSMCNKKLIGARFFNKGLIAKKPNITISMNSARDTDGHGTHTSSTAAGNPVPGASYFGYATGTATGIAPKGRVAIYKALWEEGSSAADIIAAIDQAIIDGVDVISLSIGYYGSDNVYEDLYTDPISIAAFSAVKKGIFVSSSAGNDGPDGWFSLHNGIPWVLTVGAGTMDREYGAVLTLGNKVPIRGISLYPGNYSSSTEFPIVFLNACDDRDVIEALGKKIVVCQDDHMYDNDEALISDQTYKVRTTPGLAGGIFIINRTDLEFYYRSPFPGIFVTPETGKIIKDYINSSSSPTANMEFRKTFFGTKPAPTLASYSSRGPSLSCPYVLKPDIIAPGTFVLASWAESSSVADLGPDLTGIYGKYNVIYGTSMATPHASGLGALLKGAHPEWSPAAIRSAIMTSSYITDNTGGTIKDLRNQYDPALPLSMGSGHINPNKAMDPGLIYNATADDYVHLLCALNLTSKQIQVLTKTSNNNCSEASLDLNYPSFIAYYNNDEPGSSSTLNVEFKRTVTNVGDAVSTYKAKITGMDGFQVSVTPEKLVFKKKNEELSYKLSIKGPNKEVYYIVWGYLSWEDSGSKHVVRSPIVASTLRFERDD